MLRIIVGFRNNTVMEVCQRKTKKKVSQKPDTDQLISIKRSDGKGSAEGCPVTTQ